MSYETYFTSDEWPVLLQAIGEMSSTPGKKLTLESLVRYWRDFVRSVQQGYSLTIYDYTNDLASRDQLEELSQKVSPVLGEKILRLVAKDDALFMEVTTVADFPLDESKKDRFWWNRLPKKIAGEFREDLLDRGYQLPA